MSECGFVTSLIVPTVRNNSSRTATTKKNRCPCRAIADKPSNPRENGGDDEALERSRSAFESMLSLELKPKSGKNGQCNCIWCGGTKLRKCSWCDGKGYRNEFVQKSWEQLSLDIEKMQTEGETFEPPEKVPVQCTACSGSKKLRCAYCRGSGIGSYGHAY